MTEQAKRPRLTIESRTVSGLRRGSGMAAALVVLLMAAASPALAHDFWIEPGSFRPVAGSVLAVRLRVGQNFEGDPVPRDDRQIARFFVIGESGEVPVSGPDAGDPAGRVHLQVPGPAVVGYRSLTTPVELAAAKFEAYLAEEGLETIILTRAHRGEGAKPGKEIYSRCAKSLIQVAVAGGSGAGVASSTAATPTAIASKTSSRDPGRAKGRDRRPLYERPLGFTMEIVPLADPAALKPGSALPVQLLHENKPIAGVLVVAMNAENPAHKIKVRTDKTGRARLVLTRPGIWLVKAVHMKPAPAGSGADWESLWASLTFETS